MPLRDHLRPPLANELDWESIHGGWPMVIVQALTRILPARYTAGLRVHQGATAEVDVAPYERDEDRIPLPEEANGVEGNGGVAVATAVWAPPLPTATIVTDLPDPEEYEVRIYDRKRGRTLVAAIEIVSPANKDRLEHRVAFVAKCAALLQNRVSVIIVDLITSRHGNLYADFLRLIGQTDPALGAEPPFIYAVACRATRQDEVWQLETWLHPLMIGQPLPLLPLWLADNLALPLDLETSYEQTCRAFHIERTSTPLPA